MSGPRSLLLAALAALAASPSPGQERMIPESIPDAKRKALYRDLQAKHEKLSQAMRPTFG